MSEPQVDQGGDLLSVFGGKFGVDCFSGYGANAEGVAGPLLLLLLNLLLTSEQFVDVIRYIRDIYCCASGRLDAVDHRLDQSNIGQCFCENKCLLVVKYFDLARVDPAGQTLRVKMLSFGHGMTVVAVWMELQIWLLRILETRLYRRPVFGGNRLIAHYHDQGEDELCQK